MTESPNRVLGDLDFPTPDYRALRSGLYVPEPRDNTAPITPNKTAPPKEPPPMTTAEPPPPPTPAPLPVPPRPSTPAPAAATTRPAARPGDRDEEITTPAFATVSIITLVVAALAFALSFEMMLSAAQEYGWDGRMAWLFPLIIDVGAIGGTFMGAISSNRVYRHTGHQVLAITLAASILFNLVGHDIRGDAAPGLPDHWDWTGTAAAVLIPVLLAYFVHSFSKALKAFTDQKRQQRRKDAEPFTVTATDQRRLTDAVDRAEHTVTRRVINPNPPKPPAAPKPKAPAKAKAAKAKANGSKRATFDDARAVYVPGKIEMPKQITDALIARGFEKPHPNSLQNWSKTLRGDGASR